MRDEKAFPLATADGSWVQSGMSLRNWFAGMALQGILANHECMKQAMKMSESGNMDRSVREAVADIAFNYADAMLDEAAKRKVD